MTTERGSTSGPVRLQGIGIGRAVAIGTVERMPEPLPDPADTPSALSAQEEQERATDAISRTEALIRQRSAEASGTASEILAAQADIVDDPSLAEEIGSRIRSGKTAERAVLEAFRVFRDALAAAGGYLGERAADLDDLSQRVIALLSGVDSPGVPESENPFILVAHDLAPADTAVLDLTKVLALITEEGGPTSHTAILAREKSIVAVVGVRGARDIPQGATVLVDAAAGTVTVNPSAEELAHAEPALAERAAPKERELHPGRLSDGTLVPLLANLGSGGPEELRTALDNGAEGVGLFRTEFLFLGAAESPSKRVQQQHYQAVLEAFSGQKVIFRALDAGADKPLKFLGSKPEENPALGIRGLRMLREHEDILRDQLAAIAAAAEAVPGSQVQVMAPMVSTTEETRYFTALARECGLAVSGVMVEVPACALLAEEVLKSADFASIGTNDLTQYTLAADRMLGPLGGLQDPWHPAVLRLIAEVGRAGKLHSKPVGVCGEAAADPLLALVLVGLGVTSLSMSASALCDVRDELRLHTLEEAVELAALALAAEDAVAARTTVLAKLRS